MADGRVGREREDDDEDDEADDDEEEGSEAVEGDGSAKATADE